MEELCCTQSLRSLTVQLADDRVARDEFDAVLSNSRLEHGSSKVEDLSKPRYR